ncbi:hypothetical protein GCK32_001121 [Trichostrongylus colubriformis]|uniref:Metallo-beta-lactamase domain-containing protein n=1 Tax=Trichostrongylus colubriformis TaxID=6319 RepID=A0AAN8I833_TRICO
MCMPTPIANLHHRPALVNLGQFYIEPTQKVIPTYVTQLVQGHLQRIEQGSKMTASVSLVFDGGYYILVDSPSSADMKAKETMLQCLSAKSINPGEVQLAVTTHGHPDHFGQGNFFPNARHFFGSYEYVDDVYIKTELDVNDTMKITNNVELWNTPGHTAQDISVMVSKVPCCGIVAAVGDLFYDEADALNETSEWFAEAWNPVVGEAHCKSSRSKVICHADYIIPGHGKLFKVNQRMREMANCSKAFSYPAGEQHPTAQPFAFPPFTFTSTQSSSAYQHSASSTTSTTTSYSVPDLNDAGNRDFLSPIVSQAQSSIPLIIKTVLENENTPSSSPEYNASHNLDNENILAPVVEKAAFQLAKLLRVSQDAVAKKEPYPFTGFWKDTMQRIAKDVNVNHIISQAHNSSMNKLKPFLNRLRLARDSLVNYH